jgi:peptidyl-prolyl cis-trans isomerase B (cyclophilin B)
VVSSKERRRALARAKWERQQARRTAAQERARRWSIIGGAAVGVVAVGLIGWGGYALISGHNDGNPSSQFPTDNFPSLLQPSNPGPTAFSFSSGPPTGTQSSSTTTEAPPTTPTAPTTTGTSSP